MRRDATAVSVARKRWLYRSATCRVCKPWSPRYRAPGKPRGDHCSGCLPGLYPRIRSPKLLRATIGRRDTNRRCYQSSPQQLGRVRGRLSRRGVGGRDLRLNGVAGSPKSISFSSEAPSTSFPRVWLLRAIVGGSWRRYAFSMQSLISFRLLVALQGGRRFSLSSCSHTTVRRYGNLF